MDEKKVVEEVDISKKTIIVLVVLTVIVSLVSTFTILDQVNKIRLASAPPQNVDNAKLTLTILEPPQPAYDSATGRVTLEILEPPKN